MKRLVVIKLPFCLLLFRWCWNPQNPFLFIIIPLVLKSSNYLFVYYYPVGAEILKLPFCLLLFRWCWNLTQVFVNFWFFSSFFFTRFQIMNKEFWWGRYILKGITHTVLDLEYIFSQQCICYTIYGHERYMVHYIWAWEILELFYWVIFINHLFLKLNKTMKLCFEAWVVTIKTVLKSCLTMFVAVRKNFQLIFVWMFNNENLQSWAAMRRKT